MNLQQTVLLGLLWGWVARAEANWPDFRGPHQNGQVGAAGVTNLIALPTRWSESENVTWKTALPHKGWSTPVIHGDQIWLTTATADGRDFFAICVAASTGKILYQERMFHCETPEPLGNNLNSYASSSPVIEPGRVYVHFGSYGTACLDIGRGGLETNGGAYKVLWKRDDLPCKHFRGPGSSPVLFNEDSLSSSKRGAGRGEQAQLSQIKIPSLPAEVGRGLLILTMDGIDQQYLVALDTKTGRTVWKTDRTANWNDLEADGQPRGGGDFRKAYSTPLIVTLAGRQQLLTVGSKAAYSYDPATGKEIWKLNHAGFSPAARPVCDGTNVFIATGNGKGEMLCVRGDGQGDVTDTHVVWRNGRGFPRMPSPVLADGLLFMVSDSGIASCLEAATGQELWQERLGGEFAASLLYAAGRVYCFGQDGKATVLKAARHFEVLARNQLSAGFMASPAVTGKALILRTKSHLYRIETVAESLKP